MPKNDELFNMSWDKIISEPTTKKQRQALYRLGCSKSFVKNQVPTKEMASKAIQEMLKMRNGIKEI